MCYIYKSCALSFMRQEAHVPSCHLFLNGPTNPPGGNMKTAVIGMFVAVLVLFSNQAFAERSKVGEGCFSYPWGEGEAVFWQEKTCNGTGFGGIVNDSTKITVNGQAATKRDLRYLNKKEVFYRIAYRTTGKGEGMKIYAKNIQILVDEEMP